MRRVDPRLALVLAGLVLAPPVQAEDGRSAELSVGVRAAKPMCFPERLEVTGVLAARELVEVSADREGLKVAQVLISPLEEVASGQILARLVRLEDGGAPTNPAAGAVRAPVAGMVVRSNAIVGAPVSAKQGALFAIVAGSDIDLMADVPLSDLGRLKAKQAAIVTPLGLSEIAGKVRQVEPSAAPGTQLGKVRIALGSGHDLRIGTFARGVVALGESCGLGVPYSAVSYEPEGTIVHVVNGERVEARPVEVGLLSGGNAEIRSGIAENDMVVVRAGSFVREGDRVNPITVKESAGR